MQKPEKILLVRFSSIGDILLTTPLIRALRKKFPDAEIDFLTKKSFAEILKHNPHLNGVIPLEDAGFKELKETVTRLKSSGGYDVMIDLHTNPRSYYASFSGVAKKVGRAGKNRFKRFMLLNFGMDMYGDPTSMAEIYFGATRGLFDSPIEPDGLGLEIFIDDASRAKAGEMLAGKRKFAAIAPSAKWPTKRWPAEYFVGLIDKLKDSVKLDSVLVGGPEDKTLADEIASASHSKPLNLAGELSLPETAAVIEKAALFVGNDTGLMHIASALNVPGVAIFGCTTNHLGFFPYKSKLTVAENKNVKCRPCTKHGLEKCPRGHFECMKNIPVDEVYNIILK